MHEKNVQKRKNISVFNNSMHFNRRTISFYTRQITRERTESLMGFNQVKDWISIKHDIKILLHLSDYDDGQFKARHICKCKNMQTVADVDFPASWDSRDREAEMCAMSV